jgi:hypothetical protein
MATSETFTSAQVCKATGASYRMLDSWLRQKYIVTENPHPGSGHQRAFTFKDALQVAVMVEVSNTGVYPKRVHPARVIANGGVYRKEWTTMTISLAGLIRGLRHKLGMDIDGALLPPSDNSEES